MNQENFYVVLEDCNDPTYAGLSDEVRLIVSELDVYDFSNLGELMEEEPHTSYSIERMYEVLKSHGLLSKCEV